MAEKTENLGATGRPETAVPRRRVTISVEVEESGRVVSFVADESLTRGQATGGDMPEPARPTRSDTLAVMRMLTELQAMSRLDEGPRRTDFSLAVHVPQPTAETILSLAQEAGKDVTDMVAEMADFYRYSKERGDIEDYLAMRKAMEMTPGDEELEAIIAKGLKEDRAAETDEPLWAD